MARDPNAPTSMIQERALALRERMASQHPFHEQLADAYEKIGGVAALQEWAEDNPGEFFRMMMKASPPPMQTAKGGQGGMTLNLSLHPSLAPGPLDVGGGSDFEDIEHAPQEQRPPPPKAAIEHHKPYLVPNDRVKKKPKRRGPRVPAN